MDWEPAIIDKVRQIVQADLAECDPDQTNLFQKYKIEPYYRPLLRHEKLEQVVVVARRGEEVIYWEDIEEGFNISPVGADGTILQHRCNQDSLGLALNYWLGKRH